MMRRARVLRLATAGPHDTAPLAAVIKAGEVDPATIVAIVGKTEGNASTISPAATPPWP